MPLEEGRERPRAEASRDLREIRPARATYSAHPVTVDAALAVPARASPRGVGRALGRRERLRERRLPHDELERDDVARPPSDRARVALEAALLAPGPGDHRRWDLLSVGAIGEDRLERSHDGERDGHRPSIGGPHDHGVDALLELDPLAHDRGEGDPFPHRLAPARRIDALHRPPRQRREVGATQRMGALLERAAHLEDRLSLGARRQPRASGGGARCEKEGHHGELSHGLPFGYLPRSPKQRSDRKMARAFIGSTECRVLVDRDLGDTWAVSVYPPSAAPLVVKLQGNDKEKATKGALEILQKSGQIDRFEM